MTRLKVLASVSTLALGLALSGAAFADVTADDNALGLGNATDGSNAATLSHQANGNTTTGNSVGNQANPDSSTHGNNTGAGDASNGGKNIASNNSLSNVGNSSDSSSNPDSSTHGNNTGSGDASNGGKNIASNNSLSLDNNNNQSRTKSKGDISGNGDASNGGEVEHSNNSDSSTHGNNSGTGDASNGGKVIASNNSGSGNDSSSHTKNTTIDVRAAVSNESLSGEVSGVFTAMGNATLIHGSNGATQTGNITGGTINGFAGIQTATNNTGIASLNQAATSIAANANVTFGNATP